MQDNKNGEFRSRVYTDRPSYADLPSPAKFQAIMGIIMTRLTQHPNAICSISGGSDSDILLDLIERSRQMVSLPEVKYCFFNTGLEMEATKRHIKELEEKYGVIITEHRPKKNIVLATREYGQPFVSKIISSAMECVQKKGVAVLNKGRIRQRRRQSDQTSGAAREISQSRARDQLLVLLQLGR